MTTESSRPICGGIDVETLTPWLLENVSRLLGVDPSEIDVHDQLQEYGMDSRQFIELTFDLEDLLGRKLPATLVWDNPSIAALVATLTSSNP
jgi:phthiocerol/phenolphthiocerol synthesis type-I polyketide synthase D